MGLSRAGPTPAGRARPGSHGVRSAGAEAQSGGGAQRPRQARAGAAGRARPGSRGVRSAEAEAQSAGGAQRPRRAGRRESGGRARPAACEPQEAEDAATRDRVARHLPPKCHPARHIPPGRVPSRPGRSPAEHPSPNRRKAQAALMEHVTGTENPARGGSRVSGGRVGPSREDIRGGDVRVEVTGRRGMSRNGGIATAGKRVARRAARQSALQAGETAGGPARRGLPRGRAPARASRWTPGGR